MAGMFTNPRVDGVFLGGLELVSEGAIVVAVLAMGAVGVLRRRAVLGVGAAAIVAGANVSTQFLKYQVIERPDFGWSAHNTLPSGHVTVITSLLVAMLLVVPARSRLYLVPLVAFCSACAGVGTIVLNWHRPSDVLAAYAVVLGWTGLIVASLALVGRQRGRTPSWLRRAFAYAAGSSFAVGLLGLLILLSGVTPAQRRRELMLTIAALVVVALVCAAMAALSSQAIDLLGDGEEE